MSRENGKGRGLPFYGIPMLAPYLRPYRRKLCGMALLGLVSSAADSAFPLFHRYALTHFVGLGRLDTMPLFIAIYAAVLVIQVLANVFSSFLISYTELDIGRDLKNEGFFHLQTLSFSYFNTHSVGYIHARVMSDTDRIGTLVTWRMMDMVWNLSFILFVFAVMFSLRPGLALAVLVLLPFAVAVTMYFQGKLAVLKREVRESNGRITGNFNEGITGIRSIRLLNAEHILQENFEKETGIMRNVSVRTARVSALFTALLTGMASFALALVLWRGGSLTLEGLIELGTLSVFMTYALDLMEPIQFIIQALAAMVYAQVNIERFTALIREKPDVTDPAEVTRVYGDMFFPKRENWEELKGDVEFRDVSFHYPDGQEMVLEHFNLRVPKGTNVAIVGETGAGKSTLINLVCRFYEPTGGQVLIDGRDVRERSQLWLHSNIGYVLQTPHLFSGSVRDNLRYGKTDASDEEIMEALRMVSADDIVARMGKGLDSEVGEGGSFLSTGEKQLLSFARALLADPAILVLDEATSSVDTVTEKKLQQAILTVIRGRTSFVIAHRLSTIVDADVILAVRNGRIEEQGSHAELMRKKGYYYDLYTRQYRELAEREVL